MNLQFKTSLLSLAIASSLSAPLFAQEDDSSKIERIVISSDFRNLTENELPASASILSTADIEQRQAQFLSEMLDSAPNVNFNSGAGRARFVQIRGIGERSQFTEPYNPSVGFFVDDLDFSGTMAIATLFDVEQVEVLKGPQGTTFGSSALAGSVKLKTVDPDGIESGKASLSVAQKDSYNLAAAYGNAINEKWQFRAAVQQYFSDGYVRNDFLDRDDTDNIDEFSSRLKVRYLASDSLTLDFALHYYDVDNGYDAFSLDNVRTTISDEPGFDRQETTAFSAKATWQLDSFDVQAIATTSDSDLDYGYDEDWTFVGFHPWEYSSTDHYFRERDTDSVDIRLLSSQTINLGGVEADWVTGVYFKSTDESLLRQYTYADVDFTNDYALENIAIYGEIYPQLSDKLTLTLGLRVEEASIDYSDNGGFSDSVDDTFVGGRLVLDYQMTPDMLSYVSINRGYKLGGFNTDPRVPTENIYFEGEYTWNYEVGAKQYFDDNSTYIGVAFFYMDRENTHISDFVVEPNDNNGSVSFVDVIANADIGKNYGMELESYYQLTENFQIFSNIGLLNASFENYTNAKGEFIEEQDQAQSPSYMFNIGFNLEFAEAWRLTVEADGKATYRFSDGHDVESGDYTLWHFNLNREWQDWTLSIWGKNVFNKEVYVRGFGGFSNDPRDFYETPEPYLQFGNGRQLGVTLDYRF
ncbi:TonB-dependent receptor [Planctobacterium marinum]|uniref:TonB-dependent receptor n=1 Tax=Planctobacterium marinum TaxID=1631968 RepID=A0AA48HLZ1_9ALTE|nr:TonB-dependent receptor [Planctobacterium marinum]